MDVEYVDTMARDSYANRPPQHDDDTGVDLVSCLGTGTIVGPRATVDIRLGVKCKLHEEGSDEPLPWMLISRSSTAKNTPFRLANAVGIIDAGYRGEVRALLDNADDQCMMRPEPVVGRQQSFLTDRQYCRATL